ncbi:MAG: HEAT repeat domain-containing protein [Candidatus Brocadiales bacterium]|nr:HEAT repeat domain-containing protein [Candidatus Brocadiales bacterium]
MTVIKRCVFISFLVSLGAFVYFLNGHALSQPGGKQFKVYLLVLQDFDERYFGGACVRTELAETGLDIGEDEDCDGILVVKVIGRALTAEYERRGPVPSGASITGKILLKIPNTIVCKKSFRGIVDPPFRINFWSTFSPPFVEAFEKSNFKEKILEIVREVQDKPNKFTKKVKKSDILEFLIAELEGDAAIRKSVVMELGKIKDDRKIEPLVAALGDRDALVRKSAVSALLGIEDERVIKPFFITLLNDEDLGVRNMVIEALGKIKSSRVSGLLIELLKSNKDANVRGTAAQILGEIGDNRAADLLISALSDEDWFARKEAAKALGKLKDSRAIEPLIASFEDEKRYLGRDAIEVLRKITGKDFGDDPKKWQEWWEKNKPK